MTMKQKLAAYTKEKKALLAVNFYNFETLKGLLLAAKALDTPLILQLSESSLQYLGEDKVFQGESASEAKMASAICAIVLKQRLPSLHVKNSTRISDCALLSAQNPQPVALRSDHSP